MYYLKNGFTPIYEFTHPDHSIVLDYGSTGEFKLLAARSMMTGVYITPDRVGVTDFGKMTPDQIKTDIENKKDFEGYVVVFNDYSRVKWKTKWYLEMHHMVTEVRERDIADAVISETVDDIKSLASSKGKDITVIEQIEDRVVSQLADIEGKVYALADKIKAEPTKKDAALKYCRDTYFKDAVRVTDGREPDFKGMWKKLYRDEFKLRTVFSNFSTRDE
jgi:hypothetical protein